MNAWFQSRALFSPPEGAAGALGQAPNQSSGQVPTPQPSQAPGSTQPGGTPEPQPQHSASEADTEIKKLRAESAGYRTKANRLQEQIDSQKITDEAAEKARLAEQGRFKDLADLTQKKLDAFQAKAREKHLSLVANQVKLEAGIPTELLGDIYVPMEGVTLTDELDLSPEDRAKLLARAQTTWEKFRVRLAPVPVGSSPAAGPMGAGQPPPSHAPTPLRPISIGGTAPAQAPNGKVPALKDMGASLAESLRAKGLG